jgi:hypothetical protein
LPHIGWFVAVFHQMTEKSCIVTLKSEQAKYKILNSEISLKNRSANFFEIDKNVTNVTIKDLLLKCTDKFLFIFSILP